MFSTFIIIILKKVWILLKIKATCEKGFTAWCHKRMGSLKLLYFFIMLF